MQSEMMNVFKCGNRINAIWIMEGYVDIYFKDSFWYSYFLGALILNNGVTNAIRYDSFIL